MSEESLQDKAFDAAVKMMKSTGYQDIEKWQPETEGVPKLLVATTCIETEDVVVIAQVQASKERLPDELLITRNQFEDVVTEYMKEHPDVRGRVVYESYDFHVLDDKALVKVSRNLFR